MNYYWNAWLNKAHTSTSKMHAFPEGNDHTALCGEKFPEGRMESGWADRCVRCCKKLEEAE